MPSIIEPKILKGFRDFLPDGEIVRRELITNIERIFRLYGFVPIDTPALEYSEILLGKGGGETEKQIYRFSDNGQRDVALRFDLTVPFARFTALHQDELIFPFKRYHIAKVWRGENTQKGRYREFMQCDFDTIGADTPAADFEILLLIRSALLSLGLDVNIRINHRGLFNAFLSKIGASEKSTEILRAVDKISKTGEEELIKNLTEICGGSNARTILDYISSGNSKEPFKNLPDNESQSLYKQTLEHMASLAGGTSEMSERMSLLGRFMQDTGTQSSFTLDPSITRGLDYYTGVVFETFLTGMPEIGSICSGGRYDNLCGLYTKKKFSGVGASIGLDRMIA
ncbi:MAG: histidine--tRNA ligase, partial [Treponema sp.]|nr:histidine--tRNA ligase [Treponema sp.]